MLLKTLKSNQTYHFLLVPIIVAALWVKSLTNPHLFPFYPGEDSMPLYRLFTLLLQNNPMANNILAMVFAILLSFSVLKLNLQYAFIRERTVLPSVLFVLITGGLPLFRAMHPVYFAALFFILALNRIFDSYGKESIHANAFEAGIFLSLGSLFYLNLVAFFPFLWVGFIVIKQKVNWREYVLSTLGFLLPWGAAWVFYAATGHIDDLISTLFANIGPHAFFSEEKLPVKIYIGFLLLLTLLASLFLLSQYDGKKISSRRYFKSFFLMFLFGCATSVFNPAVSQDIIILLAIPLTYLISNYLVYMKRHIWGEVFLYILTAGVIYLQFA